MPARILLRATLSLHHIRTAAFFANQAGEIEGAFEGRRFSDELEGPHRAYVMGAVLSAGAFLEAVINEFLSDAADPAELAVRKALPGDIRARLAKIWSQEEAGARPRTFDKYQDALAAAGMLRFAKGRPPFQDAAALMELRNALSHFKPEWAPTSASGDRGKNDEKFHRLLRTRFPPNALYASSNNPYFPDKCLGHGCAAWAVRSALALADEFFDRIGMAPPYQDYRAELVVR